MHFGENQLSRSLIGLSPLPTAHPPSFQPRWVRSSTRSYTCFNLAMGRSPRFGSRTRHYTIALFGLALATATPHGLTSRHATDSQAHSSKGTPPPPHTTSMEGSDGLQAPGFRYYFTPLPGYFSPFPHGTIHYRSSGGIQAAKWSWQIHTGFHEPRATRATPSQTRTNQFRLRGYHPLRHAFPDDSATSQHTRPLSGRRETGQPHNPAHATPAEYHTHTV